VKVRGFNSSLRLRIIEPVSISRHLLLLSCAFLLFACASERPRTGNPPSATEPQRISPADVKAAEPAIASDSADNAIIAYAEHHSDGADIFVQGLDADGMPKGERVRVNDEANAAKSWRGDPPTIALGRDGAVYVGWTRKYADPNARGTDLMLSVSRNNGGSFEPPVKVNDDREPASHGMHSLTADASGRIIMAWLDERNVRTQPHKPDGQPIAHHEEVEPNSEVFTAVSTDGGKSFSPNKKIAADVCPCCKTFLLVDEGGTVYASWRQVLEGDHRHMAVASSADGGLSFAPGVVVSDDKWQLSACPVSGAALSSPGPDQLDVAWYTAGEAGVAGVYSARSTDGGKSFGPRRLVSSAAAAGTPVVGPSFIVFNSLDGTIKAQPINSPSGASRPIDISDAAAPAAVVLKDRAVVAFVRTKGDSASVWTSTLQN
jgi:hypothetical protein